MPVLQRFAVLGLSYFQPVILLLGKSLLRVGLISWLKRIVKALEILSAVRQLGDHVFWIGGFSIKYQILTWIITFYMMTKF